MSVELDPMELGFKRPFTHEVSQVLRLHNPNSDPLAFKVKTTAPKQYCVRPNSGRIEPGRDVEVQVLLQAMKEDPPPDARCRDKFLVQSVTVKADSDAANVSQIWANIEQTAKSSIQEKKIRVSFLPADGGATTNGVAGESAAQHDDEPPMYSSPTASSAVTPQRSVPSAADNKNANESTDRSAADAPGSVPSSIFANTASAAGGAVNAVPTSQDELKSQLEEARSTISRLQAQAAEGVRQRKPQEVAKDAVNSVSQSMQNAPAPGGVPIQIVAGLCLLCFILAYLFF